MGSKYIAKQIFCILILCVAISYAAAESREERESRIKAAFIYHLIKFVEWPSKAFVDRSSPLKACFVGADIPQPYLSEVLHNSAGQGRKITVDLDIFPAKPDQLKHCQLLYLGELSEQELAQVLTPLKDLPILVVSSKYDLTRESGVIHLFESGNRLKLKINRRIAMRRGLRLGAELLDLAEIVE